MDQFGALAVTGRETLGAYEMDRMVYATNILTYYRARDSYRDKDGTPNKAEWAQAYPEENAALIRAMIAANSEDSHADNR